jgi:DNA processing protein
VSVGVSHLGRAAGVADACVRERHAGGFTLHRTAWRTALGRPPPWISGSYPQLLDLLRVRRYQLAHPMQLVSNPGADLPRKSWMTFSQASHDVRVDSAGQNRVVAEDARFPPALRSIPSPPSGLWYRGRLPASAERLFAVVGARAATRAGCDRALDIARGLAQTGAAIVSGGAFGIDAAAHAGALAAHGATFAVLGCGADVVYPDRHRELFKGIAASGGLLSEYAPGTPPRRGQFPARNRLIAGLAEAVIIAEAAFRSGALITARLARSFGRQLFAVPGSPGTDALVRSGQAVPATSADEVLAVLAGEVPVSPTGPVAPQRFAAMLNAIQSGLNAPADLCTHLGMALPSLLATLAEAELEGFVKRAAGNTYEVIGREY